MSTGRPQATDPSDHLADARSAPAAGVMPDEPDPGARPDLVQDEEKPARQLTGWIGAGVAVAAFVIAVFAL